MDCCCKKAVKLSKEKTAERTLVVYGCYYGHCLQDNKGDSCYCFAHGNYQPGCAEKTEFEFHLTVQEYCEVFGHDEKEHEIPGTRREWPEEEYVQYISEGSPRSAMVQTGHTIREYDALFVCKSCGAERKQQVRR